MSGPLAVPSPPRAGTGLFVTLEGGEGAGKGSALASVDEALRRAGYEVVATREPGGTPETAAIRALVVERGDRDWTPLGELLLLMADRAEHAARLIRPHLAAGRAVLCDRFEASTYAYQGAGKGVPDDLIARLQAVAAPDLIPDFTLLLDVAPAAGLARSARRLAATGSTEDRFETLDRAFHERVRASFLQQAQRAPDRWIVVDAHQPQDRVAAVATAELERRLARRAAPRSV